MLIIHRQRRYCQLELQDRSSNEFRLGLLAWICWRMVCGLVTCIIASTRKLQIKSVSSLTFLRQIFLLCISGPSHEQFPEELRSVIKMFMDAKNFICSFLCLHISTQRGIRSQHRIYQQLCVPQSSSFALQCHQQIH